MSRRRVVFVARHFWPLVGEEENSLAELAIALADHGCHVTVLTPRWRSDWPLSFMFEDVRVVRLPKPTKTWWGRSGFAKECVKWLDAARNDIDVVVAHGAEAAEDIAVACKRNDVPMVLLASEGEEPQQSPGKGLFQTPPVDPAAIVVSHDSAAEVWTSAGYASSLVRVIPPGVAVPPETNSDVRLSARQTLGKLIADSPLGAPTPLAICFAALDENPELPRLINVWRHVVKRLPDARLWIFGVGRQCADLNVQTELSNLQDHVRFPGLLESWDELLAAADVFVELGSHVGTAHSLLHAMAAGLPIVAADNSNHRRYLTNHQHALLFTRDEGSALHQAIQRLLTQPSLAAALGANARQRVAAEFNLTQRVANFVNLFVELSCENRPA